MVYAMMDGGLVKIEILAEIFLVLSFRCIWHTFIKGVSLSVFPSTLGACNIQERPLLIYFSQ